jgi:hypothetical protein
VAAAETTESSERLPQPTEEVHLPDPSYLPVLLALGVTITLVGVVLTWVMAGIGLLLTVVVVARWIGSARREMRELPLEH